MNFFQQQVDYVHCHASNSNVKFLLTPNKTAEHLLISDTNFRQLVHKSDFGAEPGGSVEATLALKERLFP